MKDLLAEYAESFPEVSILLEANVHRRMYGVRGFKEHTFQNMWELYNQYETQKDRPEQFSTEQKKMLQRAHTSVKTWLDTPECRITTLHMKMFKKYIITKEQVSSDLIICYERETVIDI